LGVCQDCQQREKKIEVRSMAQSGEQRAFQLPQDADYEQASANRRNRKNQAFRQCIPDSQSDDDRKVE
jgi:hypothetical protein